MNDELIKKLFSLAIEMTPAEQYRLAFMLAENIGFYLTNEASIKKLIKDTEIIKNKA